MYNIYGDFNQRNESGRNKISIFIIIIMYMKKTNKPKIKKNNENKQF